MPELENKTKIITLRFRPSELRDLDTKAKAVKLTRSAYIARKLMGLPILLKKKSARVIYLSPYSPEFNPIEHLWSQLKIFLRQFSPKTQIAVEQLLNIALMLSNREHFRALVCSLLLLYQLVMQSAVTIHLDNEFLD